MGKKLGKWKAERDLRPETCTQGHNTPKGIIRRLSDRPVGDPNISGDKRFRAAVWVAGGRANAEIGDPGDTYGVRIRMTPTRSSGRTGKTFNHPDSIIAITAPFALVLLRTR